MRDATKTRKIQILHHTKFKPVGWPLISGCKDCGKLFKQRDMKQACEKTAGERLQDIQHTCACYKRQEQLNEYVLKHVGCKGKLRQSKPFNFLSAISSHCHVGLRFRPKVREGRMSASNSSNRNTNRK